MNKNLRLILALLVPIIALAIMTGSRHYRQQAGLELILPIQGYDPRDLLSGHYLQYRVDYGVEKNCDYSVAGPAVICIRPAAAFSLGDQASSSCEVFIRGRCERGRFLAGIERFYIPESDAEELDQRARDKEGALLLSVDSNGNAVIKDLLFNGEPWRSVVHD
jgi:uncharacterized membrane-anchored protein